MKANYQIEIAKIEAQRFDAYLNLGNDYATQGNYNKALECFSKLRQLKPNDNQAFIKMGNVYAAQRDSHNAINCYQKALEMNPNDTLAAYLLSNISYYGV